MLEADDDVWEETRVRFTTLIVMVHPNSSSEFYEMPNAYVCRSRPGSGVL